MAGEHVRTWRGAAEILGMSEDTLARHRRSHGDRTLRPWWRDHEAVISWYEALIAPPSQPEPQRRRPRQSVPTGSAIDPREVVLQLVRGGQ